MNGEHPNSPAPLSTDPVITPGPWKVNKYGSVGGGQYGTLPIVATVEPLEGPDTKYGSHAANARLIAAAPDLLASLKEMGDWIAGGLQASGDAWPDERCLKHTEEIAARARAAVDKAEGRDTKCRCGERGCSECGEDPHAYGFVR